VFGNYLDASTAIRALALRFINDGARVGAPAPAIKLMERAHPGSGLLRELCLVSLTYDGHSNWDSFSTTLTAAEVLGRNFGGDQHIEAQLLEKLKINPVDVGAISALCEGWPSSPAFAEAFAGLKNHSRLPVALHFKLICAGSPPDKVADALAWAASELQGDLWDAIPCWIPSIVRRLQGDDVAYSQTYNLLSNQQSSGMKASLPRILSRARGVSNELRDWCIAECRRADGDFVGEVGLDLIAGQDRLVIQSLFDLLNGPEA
jgi:hypothetical protein